MAALFFALTFAQIIASTDVTSAAEIASWPETKKWVEARLLEGEIALAVESLKEFIEKHKGTTSLAGKELLNQVVNTFQMDETHKKFYHARTLKFGEPDRALNILSEVRKKEPFNEKTLLEIAWLQIYSGKCDQAQEVLEQALKNNPYSKSAYILKINVLKCLKHWENLSEALQATKGVLTEGEFDFNAVKFVSLREEKLTKGLLKAANRFFEKNQDFPLAIYWQIVALRENAQPIEDLGQKYLSICQTQKAKVLSKYENYPLLCSEEAAIQSFIKE